MAFIQVPPDSTGKLVDTTIIAGQHRENIIVGDPTTAAALGRVLRTPNADVAAGNPSAGAGSVQLLTPVTSYAPAIAGTDGQFGKVIRTDPAGRVSTDAGGAVMDDVLTELQRITAALLALSEPFGSIPDPILNS